MAAQVSFFFIDKIINQNNAEHERKNVLFKLLNIKKLKKNLSSRVTYVYKKKHIPSDPKC